MPKDFSLFKEDSPGVTATCLLQTCDMSYGVCCSQCLPKATAGKARRRHPNITTSTGDGGSVSPLLVARHNISQTERGSLESLSRQQPSKATSAVAQRYLQKSRAVPLQAHVVRKDGGQISITITVHTYRSHHCDATVPPGPVFFEVGSGAPDIHYRPTDPYTISRLSVTASRRPHRFLPKCTYICATRGGVFSAAWGPGAMHSHILNK